MQEKIEFELHLCLVSTESWVVSPKHLALWNGGTYMYIVHIAENFYVCVCKDSVAKSLHLHNLSFCSCMLIPLLFSKWARSLSSTMLFSSVRYAQRGLKYYA